MLSGVEQQQELVARRGDEDHEFTALFETLKLPKELAVKITSTKIVLCLAACLFFVFSAAAQKKPVAKAFTTTGFFNGIEMTTKESGDYCCMSVYLTQSADKTFALVTQAEGTIFAPVLVEAKTSGKDMRTISFTLKSDNGDQTYAGTVSAANLTLHQSGTKSVLKRQCSNTYSNISMGSGGDIGGTEVYITDSGGTWYALVTSAQGEMGVPVLVPAEVTGKNYEKVAFTLPGDNGERKFTGAITKTGFTLNQDGTRSVLKRKCYQ